MTEHTSSSAAKLGLLASLYFSQGLPFGFFTQALPVVLRKHGFSLSQIGLMSLLAAPWALKFLWAPAIDRLGRRKSWIVPLQLGAVVLLVGLAVSAGMSSLVVLMGATLLLNLVAATQDVATDGLAVDLLAPSERGLGNGVQVAGYRVGMIVGGGILLILHDTIGSRTTFLAMAVLTAFATLPIVFSREPRPASSDRPSAKLAHFLRRPGAGRVLLLVVAYKAGDHFATGMLRPFLVDAGLDLADVGRLLGTVGFIAGLFGALAGGALVNRLGRRAALVTFGILQAASVAGYASLAIGTPSHTALYVACATEHFAGGMATAALFTCMMDWCSREDSATDYTVQASAVVITTVVASVAAGFSAQLLGYFAHFGLATLVTLGTVAIAWLCFPTDVAARAIRGEGALV